MDVRIADSAATLTPPTFAGSGVEVMADDTDKAHDQACKPIAGAQLALNMVAPNTDVVITGYTAVDSAEDLRRQRRLAELGFLPGERARVITRGWFKRSPVAVRVADSTFALRDDEAALVLVQSLRQA